MKLPSLLPLLLFAAAVFVTPLRAAPDRLAAVYEAEGTIVDMPNDVRGPVSLRALLGLEFDPALGVAQQAHLARVRVEQRAEAFTVRCLEADGKEEWSGRWEQGQGYHPGEDGVRLLLRAPRFGDDSFLFRLLPLRDGAALLVEVQRLNATPFGPVPSPVGSFVFLRAN